MTNFQLIKSKNEWKTSPNGRNFGRGKETGVGEWNDIQLIKCQKKQRKTSNRRNFYRKFLNTPFCACAAKCC